MSILVVYSGMNYLMLTALTFCLVFCSFAKAQEKQTEKKTVTKNEIPKHEVKNFLVGGEVRTYNYSEPDFVSHTGLLYGVWGEWYWTSRLGEGKSYANLLYGALTYDGEACNIKTFACTPLVATTIDYIFRIDSKLEYKLSSAFKLFFGAGYRYLYDKGEGSSFYTRTGQWLFLPLGTEFFIDTAIGKLTFGIEYDVNFYGNVKSNLSEVSSTLNDISSNQQGGYGLELTAGIKINKKLNTSFIYESWNANDSDISVSGGKSFREPANFSQSYGLRLGYLF